MTRARNTADTQTASGGPVPPFTAGKNAIINGDFRINQRSFSSTTTSGTYGFDRWYMVGTTTTTYSAQTFTAGTAPIAGYEAINFARLVTSGHSVAGAAAYLSQKIEDVRTFAGQTVTLSFWAKAASGTPKVGINLIQNFGSGGSAEVVAPTGSATLSTSWARYTLSIAVPSVSGKTIGTSSFLHSLLWTSAGTYYSSYTNIGVQNATIDIWGVQVEAGPTATPFETATGTIQGELAACQRYYFRNTALTSYAALGTGFIENTTTNAHVYIPSPVPMRVVPTALEYSTVQIIDSGYGGGGTQTLGISESNNFLITLATSNGSGFVANRPAQIRSNGANGYIGISAEL
jgi:hypothetical protein